MDVLGAVQHVMARGIDGEAIFRDRRDREVSVEKLAAVVRDGEAQLLAWATNGSWAAGRSWTRCWPRCW